ncbi:MAG: ABC transporter permease [Planctomycetota bacterium]
MEGLFDSQLLLPLVLSVVLVVGGIGIYGFRDLRRWSLRRAMAVAGLTFREGVRRRALYVVPLAMVATVLLVLLADPRDERQAISQAIRATLFASGLIAIVVPLILGCASFPREIESRVIFSIITKPVTRLELIVGKIAGLGGLVAVVLVAMGVFSSAVLLVLENRLIDTVERRLASGLADEGRRPYLQYVADRGLLGVDGPRSARDFQLYATAPDIAHGDDDVEPRFFGPNDYFAMVPFAMDPATAEELRSEAVAEGSTTSVSVLLRLDWKLLPGRLPPGSLPVGVQSLDALPPLQPPRVAIDLRTSDGDRFVTVQMIPNNAALLSMDGAAASWADTGSITLTSDAVERLLEVFAVTGEAVVGVWGLAGDYAYGITPDSVAIRITRNDGSIFELLPATGDNPRNAIRLETRYGRGGLGLRVGLDANDTPSPVGVFAFRDTPLGGADEGVGFLAVGDAEISESHLGNLALAAGRVRVRGITPDGTTSPWQTIFLDTGLPAFFELPVSITSAGDFDLQVQSQARGQIVSMSTSGVRAADAGGHVFVSIAKALLNQWLLGLLVATLAVVFGTFVNWPVALVLTIVAIGGRWVVERIGTQFDGRDAVQQIFQGEEDEGSAAAREVVERGYDVLSGTSSTVAKFLPDVAVFDAAPLASRRQVVPWSNVGDAVIQTVGYGLPVLSAGYVLLRRREVAA